MTETEPRQVREASWRPWGFWATSGLGLVVMLAYFVVSMLAVSGYVLLSLDTSAVDQATAALEEIGSDPNVLVVTSLASAVVGTLLVLLIAARRKGTSCTEYLAAHRPAIEQLFVWLAFTVLTVAVLGMIGFLLDRPPVQELWADIYKSSSILPLLLLAIIAAPLFEESLFRGFLFRGWVQSKLGVVGTILLTSALFTALHAQQYDAFDLGQVLALGLLLGIARHRSGSLVVPVAMHALANGLALLHMAYILGV